MSRVLQFPRDMTLEEWAEDVKQQIIQNADKAAIVFKSKKDIDAPYVCTGYFHCNNVEKQEMIAHMQIDVINECMQNTYYLEPKDD